MNCIIQLFPYLCSHNNQTNNNIMTITLNTNAQLRDFIVANRKSITSINNVTMDSIYPMLEVTKRNASYYDVKSQSNIIINTPFIIKVN